MKEKIRTRAGSISMIFACAIFAAAAVLGSGITAKASNKAYTFDFRDGKVYSSAHNENLEDFGATSDAICNALEYLFDGNHVHNANDEYDEIAKYEISSTQIVNVSYGDDGVRSIWAEEGCDGEKTMVLDIETVAVSQRELWESLELKVDEEEVLKSATDIMKGIEERLEGIKSDGSSVYTFKFVFSDTTEEKPNEEGTPAQQENSQQVKDETPAAPTYEVGKTIISGKLKFEIADKEGNLKFAGVTDKKIKKITIPATVKVDNADLKVTTIKTGAVQKLKKLTSIKLGANVTTLEKKSIYNNKKLKVLDIKAAKLTTVAKGAVGKPAQNFKIKLSKAQKRALKSTLKKAGLSKYVK